MLKNKFFIVSIALLNTAAISYSQENFTRGEINCHSTLSYFGYPQFNGTSTRQFFNRPITEERQLITYNRYVKTTFDGNKVRVDVDIIPNEFIPNPVSNTYIYDGKDMYFFDNVNGRALGVLDKDTPLRLTSLDYINMPAFCFGYDISGIETLLNNIKHTDGTLINLSISESTDSSVLTRLYSDVLNGNPLCKITWETQTVLPFKEAFYLQPKYNVIVKIENKNIKSFDKILFPETTCIQVRKAPSINEFATSSFVLDNTFTVISAKFDSVNLAEDTFFTSPPAGFATGK